MIVFFNSSISSCAKEQQFTSSASGVKKGEWDSK